MAGNVFDQFDAPASSGNVFDQFDSAPEQPAPEPKKNAFGYALPKPGELTPIDPPRKAGGATRLDGMDTAKLIGGQIVDAALYHLPGAFAAAIEGDDPYAQRDWKDALVERSNARVKKVAAEGGPDGPTETAIPGLGVRDVKSLGPSLGFSGVGMGAGLVAGVPATVAGTLVAPGAGTAAGLVTGGAASGAAAYRMATNQFVRTLHEAANEDSLDRTGKPISDADFQQKQVQLAAQIKEYGLWEAIPEAASNAFGFGILKAPIKGAIGKLFGKNILTRVATKMGAVYGGELATETVTQQGQHNVEKDVGLTSLPRRSWASPSDLAESFQEIAPSTILQTTLMAGGTKAGMMLHDRMKGGTEAPPADPREAVPVDELMGQPPQAPRPPEQAPMQSAPDISPDLAMQNRDRGTAASVLQMQSIANAPDFDRLGAAPIPDVGAPMVSVKDNAGESVPDADIGREDVVTLADGAKVPVRYAVVDAARVLASHDAAGRVRQEYYQPQPGALVALNNGRTAGLQEAYARGTATQPGGYRERLLAAAPSLGIDPQAVADKPAPILVRLYDDAVNARPDIGRQANAGGSMRMSAREVARNDARTLPDLANLVMDERGDLASPANLPFIRGFVAALPEAERAEVVGADGQLSQPGMVRLRNAIIYRAYGESSVFGRLVESLDDSLRNMGRAMMRAAPKVARVKDLIAAGAARDMDITPIVVRAVDDLAKLRAEGMSLADFLAQANLFAKDAPSPEALEVLSFLDANLRSPNRIAAFLDGYYAQVEGMGSPNQDDMFGGPQATPGEIIQRAAQAAAMTEGEANASGEQPRAADGAGDGTGGAVAAPAAGIEGGTAEAQPAGPDATGAGLAEEPAGGAPGGERGAATGVADGETGRTDVAGIEEGGQAGRAQPARSLDDERADGGVGSDAGRGDERAGGMAPGSGTAVPARTDVGAAPAVSSIAAEIRKARQKKKSAPETSTIAPESGTTYGAENKVFTAERAAKARELLRKKLGQLNTGIDPEVVQAGIELAGFHIEAGARRFADYAEKMVADLGEAVRPYLRSWYEAVRHYPGFAAEGMDSAVKVEAYLLKQKAAGHAAAAPDRTKNEYDRTKNESIGAELRLAKEKTAINQAFKARIAALDEQAQLDAWNELGFDLDEGTGRIFMTGRDNERMFLTGEQLADAKREFLKLTDKPEQTEPTGASDAETRQIANEAIRALADQQARPANVQETTESNAPEGQDEDFVRAELYATQFWLDHKAFNDLLDIPSGTVLEAGDLPRIVQEEIGRQTGGPLLPGEKVRITQAGEVDDGVARIFADVLLDEENSEPADQPDIDAAAHEAATSPKNDRPEPTDAQKAAGNYKVGRLRIAGLEISVENPEGSTRSGTDPNGKPWSVTMAAHYGYIRGTRGRDKDHIDVFVKPGTPEDYAGPVFVIDQKKPGNGHFDEHKVMLGWGSPTAAKAGYLENYAPGWDGIRATTEMTMPSFKDWLESGDTTQPALGFAQPASSMPVVSTIGEALEKPAEQADTAPQEAADDRPLAERPADSQAADTRSRRKPRADGVRDSGQMGLGLEDGNAGDGGERDTPAAPQGAEGDRAGAGVEHGAGPAEQPSDAPRSDGAARHPSRPVASRHDLALTDSFKIGEGSLKQKFQDNLAAIRLLKQMEEEGRLATPDEQRTLARYVGWGGLKGAFDENHKEWGKQAKELKALLTDEEYAAARRTILDAHYTSVPIVRAIWAGLSRMGFSGGRVLEPSVGIGNFIGFMPPDARSRSSVLGVELDSLTARMAQQIYQRADIVAKGFEDVHVPPGYFDVAVGNPPFGSQSIYDARNPEISKFSLHNFFFAKSLESLRPGGVMAMVVSRYFLDAQDSAARDWIASRAKLLGAVRLPYTAFKGNANTEVVTDVIFLQKLEEGEKPASAAWTKTREIQVDTMRVPVSAYFSEHPEHVLGTFAMTGSMYAKNELTVEPGKVSIEKGLADFVATLPQKAYKHPAHRVGAALTDADGMMPASLRHGNLFLLPDGTLAQKVPEVLDKPTYRKVELAGEIAQARIKGMIGVRDALRDLMRAEMASSQDAGLGVLRQTLNKRYDAFVRKYGFLNAQANRRAFQDDPDLPLLESLEPNYDPGVSADVAKKRGVARREPTADRAPIFRQRVLSPYVEIDHADNPKDALIASLNQRGRVDLDYMAELTGAEPEALTRELAGLLYHDPEAGVWVPADDYLTGNVKAKLAAAREAVAAGRSELSGNVAALEAVQPADVTATDISVRMGSTWVPAGDVQDFLAGLLQDQSIRVSFVPAVGRYHVAAHGAGTLYTSTHGTARMPAHKLADAILNLQQIVVRDNFGTSDAPDWRVNEQETQSARAKAEDMQQAFKDWIWKDAARRERLEKTYNDRFNTDRARVFDGAHLTLPGATPTITLRKNQKDAVWRILQDMTALLDHVVGAGKTWTMVAAAVEARRMGLVRKPMFVVPNHLVRQWRDDFYKLYPNANILATTEKDFERGNRQRLFSKIATGDYDAVIVAHSAFKKIGMPPAQEQEILGEMLADITDAVEDMKRERGDKHLLRDMERIKQNLEAKLKRLNDRAGDKDQVVTFEELGVDGLFVDEAHAYKNLFYFSQMKGVAGLGNPSGSGRAFDLFVKTRFLQKRAGGRGMVVFATGTPVSNSLVEMFTVQRFLMYDELRARGIHLLDSWARTFGDVQQVYEVHPSGSGYRLATRFAKFVNLPELMNLYRGVADVITMDDLKAQAKAQGGRFPVPRVKGGKPALAVAKRSPLQERFFGVAEFARNEDGSIKFKAPPGLHAWQHDDGHWFVAVGDSHAAYSGEKFDSQEAAGAVAQALMREPVVGFNENSILWKYENLRELTKETKGKINALSITNEARKAGLDYRLIDPSAPDFEGSKVNLAVDNILAEYHAWAADRGTQLVFCDLSVPAAARDKVLRAAQAQAEKEAADSLEREDGAEEEVAEGESEERVSVDQLLATQSKFSVYDDLRAKLVARGIPDTEIAFIHDYDTADKKGKLFQAVRDGRIRVLIGSTEKMGAGMNVQDRLIAMHHLDAPWRPSDLEQRDGRGIRQGNKLYTRDPDGFEVGVYRYATEKTYDTRMWQIIEHKARGVEQLRRADETTRTIEDISGEAASAADMKAAASGNPLILEEIKLRNDMRRLEALEANHNRNLFDLQRREQWLAQAPARRTANVAELEPWRTLRDAHPKEPFAVEIGGKAIAERKDVSAAMTTQVMEALRRPMDAEFSPAGRYRGVGFGFSPAASGFNARISHDDRHWQNLASYAKGEEFSPAGLLQRIDNKLADVEAETARLDERLARETVELERVRAELAKPFPKREELTETRQKHREVADRLRRAGGAVEMTPAMRAELAEALNARDGGTNARGSEAPGSDEEVTRFSRDAGGGIHAEDLRAVVARARRAFPGLPIHALEHERQAPEALRKDIKTAQAEGDVAAALHEGEVYLFKNGLRDVAHAERSTLHEATHAGLRRMYGERIDSVLLGINKANLRLQLRAAKLKAKYGYSVVRATEEALADMGPEVTRLSGWKTLVAWVRDALRRAGFVKTWSNDDVEALVLRALAAAKRPGNHVLRGTAFAPGAIDRTNRRTAFFTALARFDDLFQQPRPQGRTVAAVAAEIDPGYKVRPVSTAAAGQLSRGKGARAWEIVTPKTGVRAAHLFESSTGNVWVNVSKLVPGVDAGNVVYGIAAGYAHNTGQVFVGDPDGLSPMAFFRRLENMIASALKFGTTDHLYPHGAQVAPATYYGEEYPDFAAAVRDLGLAWREGDFGHNLTAMLKTSYNAAARFAPEIQDIVYDFEQRQFVSLATGERRSRRDFEDLSRRLRAAPGARYLGGSKTLARAALYNTLLRRSGAEGWAGIVAALGDQLSGRGLDVELQRTFYSRGGLSEADGQPGDGAFDSTRLPALRRAAAGLERPRDGLFLRITEAGEVLATGPKGTRVPARFVQFAARHGLSFLARRRLPSPGNGNPVASNLLESRYSAPLPIEYREAGALYFSEMGDAWLDRTDRTRFSRAEQDLADRVAAFADNPFQADGARFSRSGQEDVRRPGFDRSHGRVIADFRNSLTIKAHPDYAAAKAGDMHAAARLVLAMVEPENLALAGARFGADVVYVPVHAMEAGGRNKLPGALALHYAAHTGASVDDSIVQANRAHHTGAKAMERLLVRARFDGTVEAGRRYVLVDDVTTMGGTLADLASFIHGRGGIVAGSVVLVDASRSGGMMLPQRKTIKELEARHGTAIEELFGIAPGALTHAEAEYLIGFKSTHAIRDRAAAAGQERLARLGAKGILPEGADSADGLTRFSRSGQDAPRRDTTAARIEEILTRSPRGAGVLDPLVKGATRLAGIDRATRFAGAKVRSLLDAMTPESVKAGMVSDYGIPEAVTDRRDLMFGHQRKQLRGAQTLVDQLAVLTRAESRIAYEWMNDRSAEHLLADLPESSRATLKDVKRLISDMGREAVRLGQLSAEVYARHDMAYLHRSYRKWEFEQDGAERKSRARAIQVLGDQYKGRGLVDKPVMSAVQNLAPDFWRRKLRGRKADVALKGERFIRFERRQNRGEGAAVLPGMTDTGQQGKLLEVQYWPAAEPVPARYDAWHRAGTWEVRGTDKDRLVMWRDFTKEEREKMGEIDEARYAIAKTLHKMIHDVEVGKYLEWLAGQYGKPEAPRGVRVVEAKEAMTATFGKDDWVQVPEATVPGTAVKKYGHLAGAYLPGPIWNDVRQVVNFRFNPLGETYASLLRAWKISKTALSPAVHMNNVMANFVMADWHDVTARDVAEALSLLVSKDPASRAIVERFEDSGGTQGMYVLSELQREQLAPMIEQLRAEVDKAGELTGQAGVFAALQALLHGRVREAFENVRGSKAGRVGAAAVAKMMDIYQSEDTVFRLAAFVKAKREGKTDAEAGKVARKSFLDYQINAPWVQVMRQTAFPFVSFTYRAVPMLLETMEQRPWKLIKLGLFVGALNAIGYALSGGDEDKERRYLPEEKAGRVLGIVPKLVRMPWNDAHGSPVFLDIRRFIPLGDFFDIGQTHAAMPIIPVAVPGGPLALLAELLANKSQFTGRELTHGTDTAGETAATVAGHLHKAFAPNILVLPGTHAFESVWNAGTGRTDTFGREQSVPMAVASGVGIKLGAYPPDVLQRNAAIKLRGQISEIERGERDMAREAQRGGLSAEQFRGKMADQQEKKRKLMEEFRGR